MSSAEAAAAAGERVPKAVQQVAQRSGVQDGTVPIVLAREWFGRPAAQRRGRIVFLSSGDRGKVAPLYAPTGDETCILDRARELL